VNSTPPRDSFDSILTVLLLHPSPNADLLHQVTSEIIQNIYHRYQFINYMDINWYIYC